MYTHDAVAIDAVHLPSSIQGAQGMVVNHGGLVSNFGGLVQVEFMSRLLSLLTH